MTVANVIFPAFTAPYVSYFLFPVAALAAILGEVLVFKLRCSRLSWKRVINTTLYANLISWIAGVILGAVLPSGLAPQVVGSADRPATIITRGPNFELLMWSGFGVAFCLSILIEYQVWKRFRKEEPLPGLFRTTVLAHITSYLLLIGIALMYIKLHWW